MVGARRCRRLIAAVGTALLAAAAVAGCSREAPPKPLTIGDLRMPAEAVADTFGPLRYVEKSYVERVDDPAAVPQGDRLVMESFANQRITGSAYWRYWLPEAEGRGVYKVKVTIYETPEAVASAWANRYPPVALHGTTAMELGDASFILPDRVAGLRAGAMMAEISAEGTAGRLQDFVEAYAAFVDRQRGQPKKG